MAEPRFRLLSGRSGAACVAALLLATALAGALARTRAAPTPTPARPAADEPGRSDRPRLAVLLVFDQLRGDYLERWHDLFGDAGFRRFEREGAWFRNCHYPYAHTVTAAGHASLVTGCCPATHGIIGNEWFDRQAGRPVAAVGSDRYEQVPAPSTSGLPALAAKRSRGGATPERVEADTLADALKKTTDNRARIVSLSLKDRSAVLMGGRRPDACYWFDTADGSFVTSSYYRDRAQAWVEDYNRSRPADRWFGQDWTRLRPELDYNRLAGPDDVATEGTGVAQGRTFPHPMTGGIKAPGAAFYAALTVSPAGNELLWGLARRAIEAEELGRRDVPDLLCLSFSSNDLVGHVWGPDSHEVLDVTLRTDLLLAEILAYLDEHVGKGKYVVAVTADHGICPLPEVARSQGKDAGRIDQRDLVKRAEAFLSGKFPREPATGGWFDAFGGDWIYLRQTTAKAAGAEVEDVADALAGWLAEQPGIQAAYTRRQLLKDVPPDDAVGQRVRRGFHPARSGDLYVVPQAYHLFSAGTLTGTNHGTPHPYDTHVPLLVLGPGVRPEPAQADEPVTPLCVAAILARGLGIEPPAQAEYGVPRSLGITSK
jgi:hypothetical protein